MLVGLSASLSALSFLLPFAFLGIFSSVCACYSILLIVVSSELTGIVIVFILLQMFPLKSVGLCVCVFDSVCVCASAYTESRSATGVHSRQRAC